jgi:hypothetical protein
MTVDPRQIDGAISEATGLFRTIRGLRSFEKDNFAITKSDSMVNNDEIHRKCKKVAKLSIKTAEIYTLGNKQTLIHIKEFLKQNGFVADREKQIKNDYLLI